MRVLFSGVGFLDGAGEHSEVAHRELDTDPGAAGLAPGERAYLRGDVVVGEGVMEGGREVAFARLDVDTGA